MTTWGLRTITPAKGYLFKIDITSKALNEDKSEIFHHIVSKLLFMSKRTILYIELAISFLYKRVSKSTDKDLEKLRSLLSYLHLAIDLPRIIGANGFDVL